MDEKPHSISKVAAELNVSWKSLIEYLNEQGHEVDMNMRAKIGQDMYDILEQKYRSDKQAKEESQALEINIRRQDETLTADKKTPPKKSKRHNDPAEIVLIKDTGLSRKPEKEETPPEKEEKPAETPEAKIEEKKETPAPKETEEKSTSKSGLPGLKVLGKIDLGKPTAEEKPVEKPAEKEEKKAEEPAAKVETKEEVEPRKEEKKEETPKVEAKEEKKEETPKREEDRKSVV